MECKVKIGSAYEYKWFERRQTNGWYSGKNVPLDEDAMWLQNGLLGGLPKRKWKTKIYTAIFCSAILAVYAVTYLEF